MPHYVDDFEMSSPLMIERELQSSGILRGKNAIHGCWTIGFTANPPIKFELVDVYVGNNEICSLYSDVGRRQVVEMLTFNDDLHVIRSAALHGALAQDVFTQTP